MKDRGCLNGLEAMRAIGPVPGTYSRHLNLADPLGRRFAGRRDGASRRRTGCAGYIQTKGTASDGPDPGPDQPLDPRFRRL
ncbi:hypothetical protein TRIP_B210013 [uncultured Desulfatiglans sp.]|nr:hypothetical protein TRIP_B210013 [uncultured Desulfatiglans sp.]